MHITRSRHGILVIVLSSLLMLISFQVHAEAGRVIFVAGEVSAKGTDGVMRTLFKHDQVAAGEIIRTGAKSLVQIRMIDKGFIALRPNSTVRIESYALGAKKEDDVGIFELIKGGFRAVTGIIGKRLRSSYKMRTVNATIGVRGTDYTARLCNQDCDQGFSQVSGTNVADGLYVGVNMGGISLTNDLGTLDLDQLQYGYVRDATSAPVALLSAPEFLHYNSSPPNPDDQPGATESDDNLASVDSTVASRSVIEPPTADLTSDTVIRQELQLEQTELTQTQIEENAETEIVAETASGTPIDLSDGVITSSRMVVTSYAQDPATQAPFANVYANPYSSALISNNNLLAFENDSISNGVGKYSAGSATVIDLGYDPVTNIAWGRWYNGAVQFSAANGAISNLDMTSTSLHWISSPEQAGNIALPSSGTINYNWVGNTTPTDNLGNSGILGNATLDANFTNMTLDTNVDIGINNQVWNASATAIPITSNGSFTGAMDSVSVNTGASTIAGSGTAAGFFTHNATGAGLGFSLEADIGGTATSVTGTAAFQQ